MPTRVSLIYRTESELKSEKQKKKLKSNNGIDIDFCSWNISVVCCSASLFQADLSIGKWPSLVQKVA